MELRLPVGARKQIPKLFYFQFPLRFRPRLGRVGQLARRPFVAMEGMAKVLTLASGITLRRRLQVVLAVRPSR